MSLLNQEYNQELYDKLVKRTKDIHNIIINPILIEKKRFHGSIFQGIYENIRYCLKKNISFQYFIILSNKTMFYKKVDSKNYHQLQLLDEKKNMELN